jgi:hypothetical protein
VARVLRFTLIVLYAGYLVEVGLLMLILPWSDRWALLVLRLPPAFAVVLDAPSARGLISAFGVLHLVLVLTEVAMPLSSRAD